MQICNIFIILNSDNTPREIVEKTACDNSPSMDGNGKSLSLRAILLNPKAETSLPNALHLKTVNPLL